VEQVARKGEMRNVYTILVRITEAKFPLGRYRRRWDDNIKMGRRRNRCYVLVQNQAEVFVSTVMNLGVPYKTGTSLCVYLNLASQKRLFYGEDYSLVNMNTSIQACKVEVACHFVYHKRQSQPFGK
jgi:hypothetical protein